MGTLPGERVRVALAELKTWKEERKEGSEEGGQTHKTMQGLMPAIPAHRRRRQEVVSLKPTWTTQLDQVSKKRKFLSVL
jgi:hypothetical protein